MSLARAAKRLVDQIDRAHDAYESQVAAASTAAPLVTADPVDSKATAEASTPLGAETSAVAGSNLSSKDL